MFTVSLGREMKSKVRILIYLLVLLTAPCLATAQTPDVIPKDFCLSGQPGAPIRVDIFSDYQCPSCRTFYLDTIKPLLKEYGNENKVCINYYDFPLKQHKYAFEASRYSVAARRLGQGPWQRVSEALYENQSRWADDGKIEAVVVKELSADEMAQVRKFLKDPSIDQTINQEIALAYQKQVTSTPTFFLSANGRERKVAGKISFPVLKDYLDRMLK
ncbi:MAG: hypothetical protein C0407_14250 [Desulfobacca sp.]|nr:hypothetical protein [Desulfobacca sp.]